MAQGISSANPEAPIESIQVLANHPQKLVNEQRGWEPLTNHLELHLLELPKLAQAEEQNDERDLALWGKFLSVRVDEELEELAMESPIFKQAKAALDRLSADDVARLQAEQREMALLTYEAGIAAAREEAELQGLRAGRQEGRAEMLMDLLTVKFGPQPASMAERLHTASHADLLRWSKRILTAESIEGVFHDPASHSNGP